MARKNSVAPSERQMQQLCSDLMLLIGISFGVAFAIWGLCWEPLMVPLGMVLHRIAGGKYA